MTKVLTAFVYIEKDGRILLVQEGGTQSYGLWCLPGGHIDLGEEPKHAAVREVAEETGYVVEITKTLPVKTISGIEYKGPLSENELLVDVHLFTGKIIDGDLNNDESDELDVAWFAKDHAIKLPLRWPWLKELFT